MAAAEDDPASSDFAVGRVGSLQRRGCNSKRPAPAAFRREGRRWTGCWDGWAVPGWDEVSLCNSRPHPTRRKEDEEVCGWWRKRLWTAALKTAESRSPETESEAWPETGWSTRRWRGRRVCEETGSCPVTAGWMAPWSLADLPGVFATRGNSCPPTAAWECAGRRKDGKETVCSLPSGGWATLPGEVSHLHPGASEVSVVP